MCHWGVFKTEKASLPYRFWKSLLRLLSCPLSRKFFCQKAKDLKPYEWKKKKMRKRKTNQAIVVSDRLESSITPVKWWPRKTYFWQSVTKIGSYLLSSGATQKDTTLWEIIENIQTQNANWWNNIFLSIRHKRVFVESARSFFFRTGVFDEKWTLCKKKKIERYSKVGLLPKV